MKKLARFIAYVLLVGASLLTITSCGGGKRLGHGGGCPCNKF